MFDLFTARARKVMHLANQEAHRFNHEYISTEHILLGLIKEGSGVAANVLQRLGIDLQRVRCEVERFTQQPGSGPTIFSGRLLMTPHAKKIVEYSFEELRGRKHTYVGTEHLLLGILREEESVAARILMNLGLTIDRVRAEVLEALANSQEYLKNESKSGFCQSLLNLLGLKRSTSPETADVPLIVGSSRSEAEAERARVEQERIKAERE
jgi:ATP-dependent Clp protease ATP-binding subunit ClpC